MFTWNSGAFTLHGWIWSLGSRGTGGVLPLGGGFQQLACRQGVADRGCLVDAEYRDQVERVSAGGLGFAELTVHAQAFQGGCLAAEFAIDPHAADRVFSMAVWVLMIRCGLAVAG